MSILVTGANGNTGKELIQILSSKGLHPVAAVRNPENKDLSGDVEHRLFDFSKPESWENALEGISKVFLVRPPHISNIKKEMLPFLKYLKERSLEQVLFMSVQGAENNPVIPHHKIEAYCRDLGLPWTFIRPSFFMQNLSTTHLIEIRDENRVFVPSGEGKTNFIDVRDIAEIAAILLTREGEIQKEYTITGRQSYSHREIAEHLSRILEREIIFISPGALRFIYYHLKKRKKLPMILVMLALYSVVRLGKGDISTNDAELLLERPPRSLDEFIRNHRDLFQPE
ncbi:MAG: SDR family oxidoreductase [Spirochaetales bacterium]|nr:SDR family oxidoreductase [Spirochaetales bacterium]